MDTIILKDLHFWGRHGANPGEKDRPQEFIIQCELYFPFDEASASDDLRFTVDYGRVFADLKKIVEEESFNLLEALAGLPREQVDAVGTIEGTCGEQVREVQETMDVTQGTLVMGLRTGITVGSPEDPALLLLNTVFGGGITSKLFQNVRERMSLCYYASSGLDRFKGIMTVASGTASTFWNFAWPVLAIAASHSVLARVRESFRMPRLTPWSEL